MPKEDETLKTLKAIELGITKLGALLTKMLSVLGDNSTATEEDDEDAPPAKNAKPKKNAKPADDEEEDEDDESDDEEDDSDDEEEDDESDDEEDEEDDESEEEDDEDSDDEQEESDDSKTLRDQFRLVFKKVLSTKGRDTANAILKKFGSTTISGVPDKNLKAALAAATKAAK